MGTKVLAPHHLIQAVLYVIVALVEQIPHPEDERHAHAFCFQDWRRTDSGG